MRQKQGRTIYDVKWRIDKEELSSGFSVVKQNLLKLFSTKDGDEKRRRLVVDLEPPRFLSQSSVNNTAKKGTADIILPN